MFVIKQVYIDPNSRDLHVNTGLKAKVTKYVQGRPEYFLVPDAFWGGTNIKLSKEGKYIVTVPQNTVIFDYINSYTMESLGKIKRRLNLTVDLEELDNIEGYMIFISDAKNIETDGEIIYGGCIGQAIVVLKEDQYLTFSRQHIKVINGKLMHII